jgi:transketolase C-terminal domain/subunit
VLNVKDLLVLDDHYLDGGVGQMIGTALAEIACPIRLIRRGIDKIPQYGYPEEVLKSHELYRENLVELLKEIIN